MRSPGTERYPVFQLYLSDLPQYEYANPLSILNRNETIPISFSPKILKRSVNGTWISETSFSNYVKHKSSINVSFVFSHVWATCRHSNHSPTRSGTPYPGPFRLRDAVVRIRFPTNCTRPPVRSKARAWCRSLFARSPHDT